MLILKAEGRITAAEDKTNIKYIFNVPEGVTALKIKYHYAPKTLEDNEKAPEIIRNCFEKYDGIIKGSPNDCLPVKNLVTLSLDGCGAYRGAAHRQDDFQEHIIGRDFASPGFIKGEIKAGEWDIVLNVHSVSCDVEYTVEIEGEGKE